MLTSNLQVNQSLETILICIVVLCFPRDNIVKFTCVVNVTNQTSQAFVTSSGPFGDCSCEFVHRPYNIRSPNTSQIQTFQNNL